MFKVYWSDAQFCELEDGVPRSKNFKGSELKEALALSEELRANPRINHVCISGEDVNCTSKAGAKISKVSTGS